MSERFLTSKLVLLGDWAVGKTSIRRSYMGETFKADLIPTLGASFAVKKININPDILLELQIWDISGQIGLKSLQRRFFTGAESAFLVFDLTRRESFVNLTSWLTELWDTINTKKIPVIVLGNKYDLEGHTVDLKEIEEFIKKLIEKYELDPELISYFRTSAKTGENIDASFDKISKLIFKNLNGENN